MSKSLPTLRDGDELDGKPCIVPASLRFCDVCGCLRKDSDGWRRVTVYGYPMHACPLHCEAKEEDDLLIHMLGGM